MVTAPVWLPDLAVPFWVANQVPKRLRLLQPGMTEAQVWATLGLRPYRRRILREGSGPAKDYRQGWHLGPKRGLLVVFDHTRTPPAFKQARLVGEGWRR